MEKPKLQSKLLRIAAAASRLERATIVDEFSKRDRSPQEVATYHLILAVRELNEDVRQLLELAE